MRARSRLCVIAVALCALAVTACTSPAEAPVAAPTRTTATATPTPDPTPPPPPPAKPFKLELTEVAIDSMDNSAILGVEANPVDEAGANKAAKQARKVLAAFLDAQFVDEDTRFSGGPIKRLLAPGAVDKLSDDARLALGHLELSPARTETGKATASARVLVHGAEVRAVTLTFEAALIVFEGDSRSPIRQHGSLIFSRTDDGWRATAADVRLDASDDKAADADGDSKKPLDQDGQGKESPGTGGSEDEDA